MGKTEIPQAITRYITEADVKSPPLLVYEKKWQPMFNRKVLWDKPKHRESICPADVGVLDLIRRLGNKESQLKDKSFVSPVYGNTLVATSIERMVYKFTIESVKPGWYLFQPIDTKNAKALGPADLPQIEQYLRSLDKARMILTLRRNGIFYGIPEKMNKFGFNFSEALPIYLTDDSVLDFDRVICRFDGANIWFEGSDPTNDPAKADYLRECLRKRTMPRNVKMSGLTIEERLAYTLRTGFDEKFIAERKKDTLKDDVEFGGGTFVSFMEKSDHYSVIYMVDGNQYTSHISKDPKRMVISAGLCLSGGDRAFDLKSLISVIREAQDRDLVHKNNLD